ncbi:MAG: hypothetical protein FD156_2762 [Nitrospirae bacterium]|nr:MAG: hypothetical protein FD156_2762 [Nitrospirota bacterium]
MSLSHGKKLNVMYKAFPHKKAAKYYESLDNKTAERINKAIEAISKNPLEGPHIKRLRGIHAYLEQNKQGHILFSLGDETYLIAPIKFLFNCPY